MYKYSNDENLVLREDEDKSTLTNISQKDDSKSFELLQNL